MNLRETQVKLLLLATFQARTTASRRCFSKIHGFMKIYAFAVFEDFFEVKGYHHTGYRKDFL